MAKLTPKDVKRLREIEDVFVDLVRNHGSDVESNGFVRVAAGRFKDGLEAVRLALRAADLEPKRIKSKVETEDEEPAESGAA